MVSVAIDGPAGAGKSTLSRKAAERLGYIYVDTGALYRAVALKFISCGIDTEIECDINEILKDTKVELRFIEGEQRVFLNGNDVSDDIRTPEVSMMASAVSAKAEVRAFLLDLQRNISKTNNVVMDGRDIGTVVLPEATVKIFLTASSDIRAKRRYDELIAKGVKVEFEDVYNDLVERDNNDMNRENAPLKQADDAYLFDTSKLDFEQSLNALVDIIKERT